MIKLLKPIASYLAAATSIIASILLLPTPSLAAITITNLNGTPSSFNDVIPKVTNTLLTFAGIIAVIMIIVGGIMYSLSAGDSKKSATAKDTILYAVVGLVITLLASAIVNFVLKTF